jgi:hypothetical protein
MNEEEFVMSPKTSNTEKQEQYLKVQTVSMKQTKKKFKNSEQMDITKILPDGKIIFKNLKKIFMV